MQIQVSWLLQKPTDLDLHCLQRQDISGFSRTRVNVMDFHLASWVKLSAGILKYIVYFPGKLASGIVVISVVPDQMPHSVASDLGLHCLQGLSVQILEVNKIHVPGFSVRCLHGPPSNSTHKLLLFGDAFFMPLHRMMPGA